MEHVVLGFDGSNASIVALDWVAERAARRQCRVDVVTVARSNPLAGPAMEFGDAERRIADRAPGAEVLSRTVAGGMPEGLLRAAENADLLVVGAHRRGHMRSALAAWLPLGTVSRAKVPAVVVPDDWTFNDGPIVVGIDDDDSSSAAVPFAAIEAEAAGATLSLVHAWQMPLHTAERDSTVLASSSSVKAAHREMLDRAGDRVVEDHPALRLDRALVHDNPSAALLGLAARASLLVLGTHHRSRLGAMVVGSVCQDALWQSACPVCIVPQTPQAV